MSKEDTLCEEIYATSTKRDSSGKYIVELPFDPSVSPLGDSRSAALRRFRLLERRLAKHPKLMSMYREFMDDYLEQGHMVIAVDKPKEVERTYFIPHHPIYRDEETFSKFRVVFDASMASQNGMSLNQSLLKGSKLQLDIVDIILQLRLREVVLITDIRQMYRNIKVAPEHTDFQRILWRRSPNDELQEYQLTTVTYGVKSSPFLAIRTLHQLVADEGNRFPSASKVLLSTTYMDDITASVTSVEQALLLQKELIELLSRGGFELRKWMSNKQEILQAIPQEYCAMDRDIFQFQDETDLSTKILGLAWNPRGDSFSYRINLAVGIITKRSILSEVARLYDPMGYLCPVIFLGKCLLQHLWQLGIDWDEEPPPEVCQKWDRWRKELPALSDILLPRCLYINLARDVQIHGFADSSERGYAGVVYCRIVQSDGNVITKILLAKSKVAPLKRVTLPRLELCGLVLVSKLIRHVVELFEKECSISKIMVWTDSMVALRWAQSSPHRWSTYVANRVSQIQEYISPRQIRYVPSVSNPADCASRGMQPLELYSFENWFNGPNWLALEEEHWPPVVKNPPEIIENLEARVCTFKIQLGISILEWEVWRPVLEGFSSFSQLRRITAYILRYSFNLRNKRKKRSGFLSSVELWDAVKFWVKLVQVDSFRDDMLELQNGRQASPRLRKLNPFLDVNGLLRVGGRIRYANLTINQKHPILLPRQHRFTDLVIDHYHHLYLHPGALNLHCVIQSQFWILGGRDAIRRRIARCLKCFRTMPTPVQPFMGDLPAARVQHLKAFRVTGVDYGGPFEVKTSRRRNSPISKAYMCLFVCFSTRATHIELVSELSTDAFLAALRRFVARRGSIKEMFSDCGTNFIGAKRKLTEWTQFFSSSKVNDKCARELGERAIKWTLNPPHGPNFGGLWEAGIKSAKRLISRVIGDQRLTYEELYTIMVQVEATLNSRPIAPISSDPNDLEPLTPGHFLMLDPPGAILEPIAEDKLPTVGDRWNLIQHMSNIFWRRWQREYLCTLQQRNKWNKRNPNIQLGTLVLIIEENLPPLKWRLGRVVKVHPGPDGIVRVVDVRTARGTIVRPSSKLCALPCV